MQPTDAMVGQTLDGKYRIDAELGRGGMGAVFKATHLGTERVVALKALAPRLAGEAEFLERFRREAKAAGRLRHPNIVDITDFGVAEVQGASVPYLVMEYLDGQTLGAVLKDNPKLPLTFVVDVVEQVASALAEAHGRGILHRDLKPDNLWLEPDRRGGYRIKVLDFGLAKTLEPPRPTREAVPGEATPVNRDQPTVASDGDLTREMDRASSGPALTQVGAILGTPAYMSPEQCRGAELDARSDVYSLAVITHQMLAGRPLFSGSTQDLLAKHIQARPPDLRELRPDLSRAVAHVVMGGLAKDPADRPDSAAAFARTLSAFAEGPGRLIEKALAFYLDRAGEVIRLSWRTHRALFIALGLLTLYHGGRFFVAESALLLPFTGWFLWLVWMIAFVYCQNLTWASMPPMVLLDLARPLRPAEGARLSKVYGLRLKALLEWLALVSAVAAIATLGILGLGLLAASRFASDRLSTLVFVSWLGGALLLLLGPCRGLLGSLLFVSQERLLRGSSTRNAFARSRGLQRAFHDLRDLAFPLLVGGILAFGFAAFWTTFPGWRRPPTMIWGAFSCGCVALFLNPFLGILGTLLYVRACGALGEAPEALADQFEAGLGEMAHLGEALSRTAPVPTPRE